VSTDATPDGRLPVDRLPDSADPVRIHRIEGESIGAADTREPHRHDYHELLWLRAGHGEHLLDGRPLAVRPHSLTLIGRGQVHVFTRAEDITGVAVRWRGEGVPAAPAPETVAGLRNWTVVLDGPDERAAVRARLDRAGIAVEERTDGLLVRDPAGIPMLLAPAPQA
jgi:AraC-like protein